MVIYGLDSLNGSHEFLDLVFQLLSLYRAGQGHFAVQYRGRDKQARKSNVFLEPLIYLSLNARVVRNTGSRPRRRVNDNRRGLRCRSRLLNDHWRLLGRLLNNSCLRSGLLLRRQVVIIRIV